MLIMEGDYKTKYKVPTKSVLDIRHAYQALFMYTIVHQNKSMLKNWCMLNRKFVQTISYNNTFIYCVYIL